MKHPVAFCIAFLLIQTNCVAQSALDSLRYVDFHIHTTMKNYYRKIKKASLMDDTAFIRQTGVDMLNWNGDHRSGAYKNTTSFSGFYGRKSYPQASYDYLQGSKASILCTSITPLEKLTVSPKEKIKFLGIFRISMRKINRMLVTRLNKRRQHEIYTTSGFQEYMGEYNFLRLQKEKTTINDQSVILVRNRDELLAARKADKIALVLTLEGGHILFGPKNSKYYLGPDCQCENEACYNELLANINTIKSQEHRPFFITLSHLAWNRISGQAKGLDNSKFRGLLAIFANKEKFREVVFNKHGSGLIDKTYIYHRDTSSCGCKATPNLGNIQLGYKIVNALLDTSNNQKPLLVDMRHMDTQARLEYISIVNDLKKQGRNIPLIISHAAASGKNMHQSLVLSSCPIADHYREMTKPDKYYATYRECLGGDIPCSDKTRWFFPWGINLYDEEIQAVYESDGIIGITLEERVLGAKALNYSPKHYTQLHDSLKKMGFDRSDFKIIDKLEPLMRNILYIVEHSGKRFQGTTKSWDHIALGSDFDGIVDPIDVCTTAKDIPHLYSHLCRYLPAYAKCINKNHLLLEYEDKPEILMNKLFYQNGERFILKYYDQRI
ncbi:dipeptidase [Chitinophaga filiformis]|uniref:membrane dipeptidase n=1 Tax=Chitinophaga filiformis TaxID=104663 RepID=UPI001F1D2D52|nr:membrane dipeptidase [Chitinophaga filiformis]MCF6403144.1 dipeptidase [Chitinophaga filiformis]